MANWNVLKAAVANIINANGNQEITGQLLQNVLNNIITNVGENATFAGIATLDTNPGAPDGPVFYLATTAGVYPNFNGLEVLDGEAIIFLWNNSAWTKKVTGFATQEKMQKLEENTNEKLSQLGSKISPILTQTESLLSSFENKYSKSIDFTEKDNKIYFDNIFIQKGRKAKLVVDGTAEWDLAWVFYNNRISENRLVGVVKGESYDLEIPTDITQLGIAAYTLTSAGSISIDLNVEGELNLLEKELKASVETLNDKINEISGNTYFNSIHFSNKANKTYFDNLNIKKGTKLTLNINGSAEWSRAWVFYNDDVGNNRLKDYITKGSTYSVVAPEDITKIGISLYTFTSEGTIDLEIKSSGSIDVLEESLDNKISNIELKVKELPKYTNYIDLSRPVEIGWKGKETTVYIRKGTHLSVKYNFTELVDAGWYLYANDYNHVLINSTTLSGEAKIKDFDYDIEKLILYTNAEVEGNAEFYIYESDEIDLTTSMSIGSPIKLPAYTNMSGAEFKVFAEVDIKMGSTLSLKVDGAAEWDVAWIYYNGDIAKKRLIQPVEKGKIYNIVNNKEDIYSLGFCIYTLKTQGEVEISLLCKDSILLKRLEKVEEESNASINSKYHGKVGICIGDSHAVRRDQWVPRVYEYIGATYDSEVSAFVVGDGNSVGAGYEDYVDAVFAQAYRAVEKYKQGKQIDLILLDNVHYILGDNKVRDIIPFKPSNVVNIGSFASGTSKENEWFTSNFNNIIGGITPKAGTLLKSSWNALKYVLTFEGNPIGGTTFTIIVDGNEYATSVESGDTIDTFVARVGEWVFNENKFTSTVEGNKLYLSYIGTEDNPQTTISYKSNNSGITMTYTNETNLRYVYRYFDSRSIASWNDVDKWVVKTGSFDLGGFKGAIEYIFENIPNIQIILVSIPCYRLNKTDFKTDLGYDMTAFLNSNLYAQGRARTKMLSECANYYNLKWVDIEKLWGVNIINWFDYSPENDVHPNKNGYTRIADVIISELS